MAVEVVEEWEVAVDDETQVGGVIGLEDVRSNVEDTREDVEFEVECW